MADTFYEKAADRGSYFRIMRYESLSMPYRPMPHYHNSLEVFIVVSGEYYIYINGEKRTLTEGEIAFVDGFTPHTSGSTERIDGTVVYVVMASPDYLEGVDRLKHRTLAPFTEKRDGVEDIISLLDLGYRMLGGDMCEDAGEEMKRGFISLLLGALFDHCDDVPREHARSAIATVKIMKYIGENYADDITLDTLSDKFGYERTYLSRLLNRALGMNLREYLNRVRISEVKSRRSKDRDTPIYKLAMECGFKSENTFFRAFKKYG